MNIKCCVHIEIVCETCPRTMVITIKLNSNHKSRINSIGSAPFLTDTVQVTINPQIIEYLSHLRFAHRNSYNANLPARQRPSLEFGISYVSYAMFYLP